MKIPDPQPSFTDIARQMRINVDILKEEITNHINTELKRFRDELEKEKIQKMTCDHSESSLCPQCNPDFSKCSAIQALKDISKILDNLEYERSGRVYSLDEDHFTWTRYYRNFADKLLKEFHD